MRKVIAIAAPVGGGKSALAAALARALGDCPVLHFDDYQLATRQSVDDLKEWLAAGADFDALPAPGVAEALDDMRGDEGQTGWVVFEMPLGREYRATAASIDLLIWLDVPLDIALARKLRELVVAARPAPESEAHAILHWIDEYLGHYLAVVRNVLQVQRARIAPTADLLLDGGADTETLLQQLLAHIGQTTGQTT